MTKKNTEFAKLMAAAKKGDQEALKKAEAMVDQALKERYSEDQGTPNPSQPDDGQEKSLQKFTDSEEKEERELDDKLYGKGNRKMSSMIKDFEESNLPNPYELVLDSISHYPEQWSEDMRNWTWQQNQRSVRMAMHNLMMDRNTMPTVDEISKECKLSRMTVNKHIKEIRSHPMFMEEIKKFEIASLSILTALWKDAINNNNVKAARLYFEIIGNSKSSVHNQTNNYLTINNLTITRQDVEQLPEAKRKQLEAIFQKGES